MSNLFRIVWAEDKGPSFRQYKRILDAFVVAHGVDVEILWAKNGDAVYRYLLDSSNQPDLLVVDLLMPSWNGIETVKDLSVKLPRLPKIVISQRTEEEQFRDQLRELVVTEVIQGYFAVEPATLWCEAILALLTVIEPRILHISDLHFGASHAFKGKLQLEDLARLFVEQLPVTRRPNMLVVSGDLADRGTRREFDRGVKFLSSLIDITKVDRENVIIVPGNHDVFRGEEPAARLNNYVDAMEQFYGQTAGGRSVLNSCPFIERKLGGLTTRGIDVAVEDSLFAVRIFTKFRLVLIAMNSVIVEDDRIDWGEISERQLLAIRRAIASLKAPHSGYLRVAVFHHHLFPVPSFISDGEPERVLRRQALVMRYLASLHVQLILHGHTHYTAGYKYQPYFIDGKSEETKPIHVLGTGTLGSKDHSPAQSWFHAVLVRLYSEGTGWIRGVEAQPFRLSEDSLDWVSSSPFMFDLLPTV